MLMSYVQVCEIHTINRRGLLRVAVLSLSGNARSLYAEGPAACIGITLLFLLTFITFHITAPGAGVVSLITL